MSALDEAPWVPDRPDRLEHIGYVYDAPDDLVAGVLPRVRATLAAGGRVSAIVERRHGRALRDAVGADGARGELYLTPPAAVSHPRPGALLDHLGELAAAAPGLVLAQYSVFELPDVDLRHGEDQINRVLPHLPVTLVCACSTADRAPRLATARATHPWLIHDGVAHPNPVYRPPDETLEVRRDGDTHVLAMTFHGTGDLRRIRARVRAVAAEAGLRDERVRSSVIAVHEAAMIVTGEQLGSREPGVDGTPDVSCELDVWASEGTIGVELRGVRPAAVVEAGEASGSSTRRCAPLDYVRLFCRDAACFDTEGTRVVRILA